MAGSYGYNVRWAFGATGVDFTGSGSAVSRFPVIRDTIGLDNEKLQGDGTTGTRSLYDVLARDGVNRVTGQIEFEPTFNIFDKLLPYILGGSESSDTFPIADTLPAFDRMKDMGGDIVTHTGIKVSKADITFGPGLLKLTLDCIGKAESLPASWTAATAATLGTDAAKDKPYAFQDCTVTINSGTRKIRQGVLSIDNNCEAIYSSGSSDAEEILPQGSRIVTLTSTHPSSSTEWDELYSAAGGNTASIVLAYDSGAGGDVATTFSLRKLSAPKKTPVFESKGEIFYVPAWQARYDGTNAEIIATNIYTA